MRIAWFSPLPPQGSGIADYAAQILDGEGGLRGRAGVTADLWVDGVAPDPAVAAGRTVIDYRDRPGLAARLAAYDGVVYHVGNHPGYHAGILEMARRHPGIVVLHDYVLHHFLAHEWLVRPGRCDRDGYVATMRRLYGDGAAERAAEGLAGRGPVVWETEAVVDFPLCEGVVSSAAALVSHSDFVLRLVGPHLRGPGVKLNQPADPAPPGPPRPQLGLPENRFILSSFGFVTPNKRLDVVIDALAADPELAARTLLVVIGEPAGVDVRALAAARGVAGSVMATGRLPERRAFDLISASDACVNLRRPTMGETSAALLRIMSLGKPAVISDHGWYAELPDGAVVKVPPDADARTVAAALRRLEADADFRERTGRAAREHALSRHTVAGFVDGLLDLVRKLADTPEARAARLRTGLLTRVADELCRLGPAADLVVAASASAAPWTFTGREEPPPSADGLLPPV
jgi:glycosyltransferase involved in cell wall biosynthesis